MTTNINNSPEYACRTCSKQECGCKDTECQLPCHFYTEQAEQEPVAWALSHSFGLEFSSKYPMQTTKEAAEQMARQHMGAVVVTPLYAAPVPVTTPDVCGEVCARAKLCYGCNKNLEEANAKYVEQVEQEPVAAYKDAPRVIYLQTGCEDPEFCECSFNEWGDTTWCADKIHDTDIPYIREDYAAPVQQTEQEPVACIECGRPTMSAESKCDDCHSMDDAAPVRTKDLTDDEIDRIACNVSHKEFARAVIAADREKNK